MEEVESEEYIDEINPYLIDNNSDIYKNNNSSQNEDPIPHIINPSKNPVSKYTSASYILSYFPKMNIDLNQIKKIAKNKIYLYLIKQNLQKYNSTPDIKDLMIIEDLIQSKETHYTSLFKDYLIIDYAEEFLRGFFNINECKEVLPKFYDYYKNYLKFFCKSTFNNFYMNDLIQEYGENQAEVYYNINYKKKERIKKKDKKENIDDKNFEESKKNKNSQTDNMSNLISFNSFFTKSVENNIKNENNNNINKKKQDKDLNELSNIKPLKNNSRQNTINLPDNSTVSIDDIITKKSSIINIIDLMNNKIKKKKIIMNKKKKNKKIELIIFDNKKSNNNRNVLNKKHINSFSKTSSNLNDKSRNKSKELKNKSKKIISRNRGNNTKINNIILKNNKILSSSNYIKYIDILKNKKNIKNNISKNKVSQNELILTTSRILKNKKSNNNITSFNTNENNNNKYMFSNSNTTSENTKFSKNKNHNINKINLSLKIKRFYQKIKINNNTLYPLNNSKSKKINKNYKDSINKKSEPKIKEKNKSKIKSKTNKNTNNNFYSKKNINSS